MSVNFVPATIPAVNNDMELLVRTYEGDAGGKTFTLPLVSGQTYDFEYEFDGVRGYHNTDTDLTVTATVAGTYVLKILGGSVFASFRFANGGDKLKLIEVQNWGDMQWTTLQQSFDGCTNLEHTATDTPDWSQATSFLKAFRYATFTNWPLADTSSAINFQEAFFQCPNLVEMPLLDTSNVTNFLNTWHTCSSMTVFPLLDTSSATSMLQALKNCTGLDDYDLPTLDLSSLTNGGSMLDGVDISTTSWSDILVLMATSHQSGAYSLDGGNAYHNAAGATAITTLQASGWTITDGGLEP